MASDQKMLAQCEIRTGRDGRRGIYLRSYNVRLATFNANSKHLQAVLQKIFANAAKEPKVRLIARIGGKPVNVFKATLGPERKFKPLP